MRKDSGFMLLQLMINVGVIAVVLLGIGTAFEHFRSLQNSYASLSDFDDLKSDLKSSLAGNPVSCGTVFPSGTTVPGPGAPAAIPNLTLATDTALSPSIVVGGQYKGLTITGVTLTNLGATAPAGPPGQSTIRLDVTAQKIAASVGAADFSATYILVGNTSASGNGTFQCQIQNYNCPPNSTLDPAYFTQYYDPQLGCQPTVQSFVTPPAPPAPNVGIYVVENLVTRTRNVRARCNGSDLAVGGGCESVGAGGIDRLELAKIEPGNLFNCSWGATKDHLARVICIQQ